MKILLHKKMNTNYSSLYPMGIATMESDTHRILKKKEKKLTLANITQISECLVIEGCSQINSASYSHHYRDLQRQAQ